MYQVLLYIVFLALSSAAPYSDSGSTRLVSIQNDQSYSPQPSNTVRVLQRDETDLVDSLGAGYSYFKKQPIVSRPLIQQKMAISEQQVPITSLDDNSIQWSDYTKSSAFLQPAQTNIRSSSHDLLPTGDYGQQPPAPSEYGNQQEYTNTRVHIVSKPLLNQDQGTYGSSYGQVPSEGTRTLVQKPLIRDIDSSYGSSYGQVPSEGTRTLVQRPLIRDIDSSYGSSYGQVPSEGTRTLVQKPLIRDIDSSYGQQDIQIVVQQPVVRNFDNSYGQQETRTIVQRPVVRNFDNSYGQQQPIQKTLIVKANDAYGQQPPPPPPQPTYGQQPPPSPSPQPTYGQQPPPSPQPTYGQQPPPPQPTYGQQPPPPPQPTYGQQPDLSRNNLAPVPSPQFLSRAQSVPRMSNVHF